MDSTSVEMICRIAHGTVLPPLGAIAILDVQGCAVADRESVHTHFPLL